MLKLASHKIVPLTRALRIWTVPGSLEILVDLSVQSTVEVPLALVLYSPWHLVRAHQEQTGNGQQLVARATAYLPAPILQG